VPVLLLLVVFAIVGIAFLAAAFLWLSVPFWLCLVLFLITAYSFRGLDGRRLGPGTAFAFWGVVWVVSETWWLARLRS
jgi:hypothetical protein